MEITPAILTSNESELISLLIKYKNFKTIDIDISKPPFTETQTLESCTVVEKISELGFLEKVSFGFHLMVKDPEEEFKFLKNSPLRFKPTRIYFHQESDNAGYFSTENFPAEWSRGVAIKAESEIFNIEFYTKFEEVQIMTVEIGKQGNELKKESLEKIPVLRELGFKGKISLDGSVNTETASLIKKYSPDRVSVGSYFSKSEDINKSLEALILALN